MDEASELAKDKSLGQSQVFPEHVHILGYVHRPMHEYVLPEYKECVKAFQRFLVSLSWAPTIIHCHRQPGVKQYFLLFGTNTGKRLYTLGKYSVRLNKEYFLSSVP